jgi:hypothetical protein
LNGGCELQRTGSKERRRVRHPVLPGRRDGDGRCHRPRTRRPCISGQPEPVRAARQAHRQGEPLVRPRTAESASTPTALTTTSPASRSPQARRSLSTAPCATTPSSISPPTCQCASSRCRDRITGWKDLPAERKAGYTASSPPTSPTSTTSAPPHRPLKTRDPAGSASTGHPALQRRTRRSSWSPDASATGSADRPSVP